MDQLKCPVCRERKPRRSCPALGTTICTVCCATKRQVEIACPSDCIYLASARSHPPAVVQRRQERDMSFVLPIVSELTETQYRLLLLFQSAIVSHAPAAVPALRDEDVAEAAAAAAATLETARKGIIYEHQAVSVPAQRLTSELGKVVADLGGAGRSAPGQTRARCCRGPSTCRAGRADGRQWTRGRRAPGCTSTCCRACSRRLPASRQPALQDRQGRPLAV